MSKAIIDHGLRFSVHSMVLSARPKEGRDQLPIYYRGAWQWTRDSEPHATINYVVDQAFQDAATLELSYRVSDEAINYSIALTARPCRFGGWRWFAICPHTGLIVRKVYLPCGAKRFLARQAYRVAYQSQGDTVGLDRAYNRRNRHLFYKLKSDDPQAPLKPKWMRSKTYQKHVDKLEVLNQEIDTAFLRRFGFGIDTI